MANENRLKLFNALGKAGYDIGSYDDFDRRMNNPEDREKFYNAIGEAGYDIGDRDEFERRISPTKYKFTIDGKEVGVSEKEYKDYVNRQKPDYQQTLDDVQQTLRENQRTMNRIGSQQQRIGLDTGKQVQIGGTEPYRLGENRKVTKGEQRLNPETGQLEDTYITESGNEYESREMADLEQNAVDQAEWERNNPKQAIKNNIDSQIKNIESRMSGYEGQWVDADGRVHYSGGSAGDEAMRNLENARHDLMEARQQMDRTEQLQKSSDFLGGIGIPFTKDFFNNWKNFGYAVWDKLSDVGWWEDALTGGVNDLEKAGAYMKIKNKVDSGIPLTDQETDVVLSAMATAQAQQYVDLPMGYTAGEITADMAPFMAQMAVNPASGLGRGLARQAVRRYGRHGIGAVSKRVAARVLGNLGEAAVLSNTLQAPRTIGNAIQRYTGDSFVYDEDGNLHMGHYEDDENGEPVFVEGGDNALSAAYKGEVSSIIENFTELGFGGNVNKFVKKMATSKAGRALGIDYLSDLVGKVGTTPFAKNMKKFMERTHWDGMIEEPLEEEYGIILNAFLGTGDNKISDLWDSEQQAQIFAGTLWFGGMMSAMNTAAYPLYRRRLNQQVAQADTNGQIAFGDEWEVMKDAINMIDDKDIGNYLYSIKDNDAFSNEQKAALFGYAARLKQQQGANVADMLMRMEGNLGDVEKAERAAYDAGTEAETADEKKKFVEDAVKSELNLFNYGKEFATMITAQSDDPANTIDYLLSRRDIYTDEQIAAASDYYQKQARAAGVIDAAEDAINTEVERANAEVKANTHQDTGSIVTVQSGDVPYYVIGGEIVDDGNGNVLLSGTGGAMVVKNALTGEVSVMSPQEMTVVSVQNADDLIQQNETVLREQLTKQADDDITYGSPANEVFDMEDTVALQDGQGGVIEGQIVGLPNAVDGVFVVQTNDGRALQMTADEMNRRIVGHNGVEVQRGQQPEQTGTQQPEQTGTQNLAAEPQGTVQGADLNNAGGEAGSEQTSGNEPPASALSKIPVRMGADGKPLKGKNGRPILDWHKASVEDAAAALVETTGGDKVMARDTATDLVKNEQARLEKIRKQNPKGDDPIEIAESRVAIRKQEQEQQAVIKHWKDVNQLIQQQMRDEQEQAVREREAAKSKAQRQREAEEARIRQEQQDKQDRQRLREQIEKDKKLRNQEYQPLTQAKKDLAGDSDALSVLDDVEPRGLDEWVSYLLRPHSILWKDASDAETGLQTELGLKRGDLQRMMSVVGTSESGAQPFNKIVMEIHEGLPDAMKEQYTDQDVRNTLLGLFAEGSSARMLHLTEEHRIEEAREMMKENERRDAEAELDAWAEFYHLTPEEREDFEDWLQLPPTEPEQEVINNIIAEHAERQSNGTSPSVGEQPVSGTVPAGVEGSEGQVQGAVEAAGNGVNAETVEEGAETGSGEPAVSDDQVAGGAQVNLAGRTSEHSTDREALRVLFDQIGEDVTLADRMSDYEVEQLTAMIDDWEEVNSDYGQVIEEQDKNLKSKNKTVRDAAKATIDEAQAKANETYEPIEMYLEELNTKYGIEKEEPFDGAIPTPKIDMPRYMSIRQALVEGYRSGDKDAIQAAAQQMQAYVDEGLDHEGTQTDVFDIAEEYDGNDPEMLADQYIIRTYWDRYLDDDEDQEYIKTGLKPEMREIAPSEQLKPTELRDAVRPESAELGVNEANEKAKLQAKAKEWLSDENIEWAEGRDLDEIIEKFGNDPEPIAVLPPIVRQNVPTLTDDYLYCGKGYFIDHHANHHPELDIDEYDNIQTILDSYDDIKDLSEDGHLKIAFVKKLDKGYAVVVELSKENDKIMLHKTFFYKDAAGKRIPFKNKPSIKEKWSVDGSTTISPTESQQPADTENISALDQSSEGKGTKNISNNQENLGKTSSPEEIAQEEAKVDTNPTEGQKEAGNYQKGHINVDGYDITIENPKGSVRSGVDSKGNRWETTMHNTYGYIRGTEGVDGDHIDVFLSDNPTSGSVFVVDQVNPESGAFDEHKVMYGFASEEEAREAYLSNYSEGWQGLGAITEVSREEFKKWVESSHRKTKPFAEYKSVKKEQPAADATETVAKGKKEKPVREHKRLVSDEKMEELKRRLLEKMSNLNEGLDMERMLIGAAYAAGKIERGVTKFADFCADMIADFGDGIREYLKLFYNGARDLPEAKDLRPLMDDAATVDKFDVFNFDKQGKVPTAIEKAEQVTKEQKVKRQAKKIKAEQGDLFAGDLFGDISAAEPQSTVQPAGKPQNANNPKTPWWSDTNRPASVDPSDYRTYMTDEAKAYFAQFKSEDGKTDFTKWAHPNLAYITAAVWDGVNIPVEELMQIPEIQEAENNLRKGSLTISDEEKEQLAQRLLDNHKGEVRQERKAFFIIGRPAGGKSSVFADPLSRENGARIVDADDAKPWLEGYDGGNGAGYVQQASDAVMERAVEMAAKNGDNIVIPKIGGNTVAKMATALRLAGYDVQLYYNDVAPETSYMRSSSRFAQTGRYLSLQYLTEIDGKISKFFSNFAEKSIGDYLNERTEEELQNVRGRFERLRGQLYGGREGLWESLTAQRAGNEAADGAVQGTLGSRELHDGGSEVQVLLSEPIFTYSEWKSNDVARGEKPKEIWNSKSGQPMPTNDNNNEGEQKIPGESSPVGGGTGQTSRPAERAGAERSSEQNRAERSGSGHSVTSVIPPSPQERYKKEALDILSKGAAFRGKTLYGVESDFSASYFEMTNVVRLSNGEAGGSLEYSPKNFVQAVKKGQLKQIGVQANASASKQDLHKNKRNNVGERGKNYAPTSVKARFNANVEAIKMMRALMEDEVEAPTKDQMEVLRQYSGWGGLGTYFNDETSAENKLLRELLTEEEYNDAVMSINSAYYTPANVIDTLWDIAKAMGFKGGKTLEGSAGIGNIIGQMPQDMSRRSDIEAVEIDTVSGNILRLLYPDATVHIQGFQDTVIPNGSVDLAITNVPFVTGLHVIDKVDKDLSRRFTNIHDFCIAKNIRKLKEGGIGIFITSAGTMDKSNDLRAWITDEGNADVVGAFRMNNETFGGTKVTSDIIVVRKRLAGKTSEHSIDVSKASPMRVGTYEDKWGEEKQVSMVVNDYFKEHPEMMAGEMAFGYEKGETFRPGSYGLYPVEGKDQDKMLQDFVKQMEKVGKAVEKPAGKTAGTVAEPNQLTAEKEGRMLIDDKGRLCVSERGQAVPLQLNAQKVKGYSKEQCFKDYQEVQQAVDAVLQQQLNDPDDAALEPKLKALNTAFDKFVKRYGNLHKNTSIAFLRNDIDFPSFLALENYSETKDIKGKVTVTTRKAPIFKQRVLGFKTEPEPKTIKDAVIASIFRSNGIDLDWIAERLNHVAAPPNGDNWTTEDVRKGILISRLGFEDPSTGQLVVRYKYLSGNVREKLAIAEQYNASGETAGRYATNVEELRKVVPMDIPAHLIDFSLGSSWIPVQLYKDYMKEMYDLGNVSLSHVEGSWIFDEGYSFRNEKNRVAGVYSEKFKETIYGHQLVAAALNNRPVKVAKQVRDGYGSSATTHTEVDQAATQACAVRVDEIKEEFKQWAKKRMQDDPELAATIEKIYNEKFNALVPMEIGDEFLPEHFEGSNVNISLYGHQKRGVMRGVTAPTMLAHEVGTGKSFTLITTAMEMRRLGTAKKPMIVVQNATVAQMTADAKLLYPNAKVLSLSEKDRTAEGRRSFYAKIKFNDWDLIIVPQSTFERIPDSPERELQFIQEKIDEKKHVIEAASRSGMNSRDLSRLERELKALEQDYGDKYLSSDTANDSAAPKRKKKDAKREAASLDKAETKAKEMLDRAVDDVQFFDDLGVDALLVDEAHEYKHLGFQTSIGRGIKGIDPSYSKKCAGLYNKTRSVFERAGWKNVVFATGTPISNTAAEIWTFMKYLMPADVMRENDIYYFDDFVHNFGSISQMLEFATSGKFKENTRFAAYVNKPELIRIWSQVADTVLTKEVGAVNEKIPEEEGGKDQDVFLPQSPSLIRIMAAVRAELERFENMTGQEKKENSSIPLTMYGIAKRAAIDPRLVDAGAPDEPMSKTNAAVKEIVKDLEATKEYKGTVAVFCDNQNRLGKTADGKSTVEFNIYDDMREKLIKAGVPAEQIAIIKSGMSIVAKQKVFDAVNSGDIRVVLGSTQTLGTGVNMQERLHLLIHMDAPDRPMDYTQRNGRIKRQGNLHKQWGKSIRVIRFGVEDSLDVTAYQRLKTKSGFIDSIMDGKGALKNNQVDRTVEEEEEGLFDNPVAVLSGSQYALKKNQAERELRKYQGKKAQWEADQVYVTNQLRHNKNEVEADENLIRGNEQELAQIKKMFPDGTVKVATVEGVKVDLTKDDGAKKLNEAIKEKINDPVNAIVKRNRENPIYNDETLEYTIELDGYPIYFKVEVVREAEHENGRIRTVIHKITSFKSPDLHIETMGSSRSVKDFLDEIMEQVVTGQDYQDRIDALQASIERINRESEQLQQRVGLEFQFGKELEEAQKHVEEYTELMKKEMEEKEAKYAAQQKEASKDGGFDLHKAEDSEEDEDLYSAEEDWDDTKTEAFKNYFGDWENDPENASKVVDADGRPLVVYHYTNLTRNNKSMPFWEFQPYSHFGTRGQAKHVDDNQHKRSIDVLHIVPQKMEMTKTYPVYLNIRNPKRVEDVPLDWDETHSQWWGMQIYLAVQEGYDGIVYLNEYEDPKHPADSWIAFYPEQVKSADENVGSFDPTLRDIRYRDFEVFNDGERIPINVTFGYSNFDVTGRSASYSTDLMPDTYTSERELLEAVRRQYPAYYVHVEDGQLVMDSWKSVMKDADVAETQQNTKQAKAHESFIERKTRNAINAVEYLAKRMGLDVEVLTSTDGLTGKKARAKGWFNPKTHKIVIVLPNHANQSDLINTLLHEGVAHYGLRNMFGPSFDTFLDNVYNNVSPEIKARIDAAMKRNGWSQHTATEEYLARLAERTDFEHATEQGWWQKIKMFFLDMLAKAGFSMELSDNDLRYILWRSYDNLLHPDKRRNIFDKAREVEMQRKLDIRRTRERNRLQATGKTDTNWIAAESTSLYKEANALIDDLQRNDPKNIEEELSIRSRVRQLPENQLQYAYKRINDMMLDENGLDLDEHFEKTQQDWIAANGIKGLGKVVADDMQAAMDKYGSGMIELRWELLERINELGAAEPLMRDDDAWSDDVAQETYEKEVAKKSLEWQEAWQDSMASLKAIQDAIAKETGNVATGAEDAYRYENRMHGKAKNMAERYDDQYYRPMLKAFYDFCKKQGLTVQQGMDYLVGKSGLERNQYFAFRDAMKEKLAESIKAKREKLEKDYAKGIIDEGEYKYQKSELEKQEREGVDDAIKQLHEDPEWTQAKEDYDKGDISYEQMLDRREQLMRKAVGSSVYDSFDKDYSGLTETYAKALYDDAQEIKKQAQRAIDREEKRQLWSEYDQAMKTAYETAKAFATDAVTACEKTPAGETAGTVAKLWSKINAATEETLKESYENGLMDRATYNKVRAMFDYYVPLRGWDEDKASDVYTYMGKENVFSPAIKKTWGRTSKAENPLAYIGNIAISAILSGERNQMKQHFLNYVQNNPTSLVSISESWYENIGSSDGSPVWVLRSADTAGKSGDELADAVNDFNEEMRLKARDGKAIPVTGRLRLDVHATQGQKAEHVVEVQRAGHTYQLYINGNPKAAQALNGSAARAVSRISDTWLGKLITNINRSMAQFFTSKNPAFVVSNLSRDLNMAGASVAVNEGAEYNARFIANVAKVLSPRLATGDVSKLGMLGLVGRGRGVTGLMPKLMRKYQEGKLNERNETERLFREFMNEGGETGFVNMLSIDSFKRKMQREIEQMNGSSLFGRSGASPYGDKVKEVSVLKALRLLGDTFEFYNRCAEDATRFIVYMTSRQMGKTLEESIADAKDVTLNFNRKGTGAMGNAELRDLFIFVNPAIQALANMYRMLKGHPLKLGAVTAAFVTVGALMPIINQWLLNMFGDDDDKDAYWNLPPWVRKNNLVMWMPGTKNFVTIPLAQEFRVFYGVGEMASSLAMEHPVDKWGLEIFSSVADLVPINPTGNGGNLMVDFAPTIVQPLMQIGENVDFTGKPIWRENQGNKYAPMYTKAYVTTPRWMMKVSEGINDLTGGNEGKKGLVEEYSPIWGNYINNPAVWNHLLQGYFGGMYNTVAKAFDVGVTAASGEMPKVYQTPVINRFLNRPVERDNAGVLGEDYYHLKEQRDALQYELKVWQKKANDSDGETVEREQAQEHVDEILNSEDWKRAEVITHYERIIKELKAGEQAATEKEDKQDIKRSISLYKQQMMEELAAIDGGVEPLDAAMEQYRNAKSLSEKKKLKLRIERLANGGGKPKVIDGKKAVEKALSYQLEDETQGNSGADRYLELASAENVRDDARIKAAKALIKPYTEHYKDLTNDNKAAEAAKYRKDNEKWFAASQSIGSHERAIAENRKLLGKGNDTAIMKIIDIHRKAMLKAIEQLE